MHNTPKLIISATAVALLWLAPVRAAPPPAADAADSVFSSSSDTAPAKAPGNSPVLAGAELEKTVQQLQKRLEAIETRLGTSSRPPSITYNMERRLADLERRIQQLEQQTARLQQLDQRVRRLEMK